MKPLGDLRNELNALRQVLAALRKILPEALTASADAIEAAIENFEPRISLIGQVKAGKTALANALIGAPELLPSDVNPWTSVVTAVHLNGEPPNGHSAVFRFFDEKDWDALVESGGRFGEMADRADATEEARAIEAQVASLRARTSERLGRNYRLLLGQAHRFRDFTPGLVRRYVCLGDEMESKTEGRFADLTRSADLYIKAPEFGLPLVIEDTPGVNDPFLVREQMTIETLGRASMCVLVLSAYQALSTVDLGLMRLLRTLRAEQVVIFVNRVDELTDRTAEVPRIDAAIRSILRRNGLEGEVEIVFGSAAWAHRAITGSLSDLSTGEWDALTDPSLGNDDAAEDGSGGARILQSHMRTLSGLPELKKVLAERIASGPGRSAVRRLVRRTRDLVEQCGVHLDSLSIQRLGLDEVGSAERLDVAVERIEQRLSVIERAAVGEIEALHATIVAKWVEARAPELTGADGVVETGDLRAALAQAYEEIAGEAVREIELVIERTEADLRAVYKALLGDAAGLFPMVRPHAPAFGRPTPLARSSSLDIRGSWFDSFRLGRTRDARREARFRDLAEREFREILAEIERGPIRDGFDQAARTLHDFVLPHVRNVQALARDGARKGGGVTLMTARTAEFREGLTALRRRLDKLEGLEAPSEAVPA